MGCCGQKMRGESPSKGLESSLGSVLVGLWLWKCESDNGIAMVEGKRRSK